MIVLWNAAAERVTGVPAGGGPRPPARARPAARPRPDGDGGDRLVPVQRGGEQVWLSVSEAVMRDPAGEVAGPHLRVPRRLRRADRRADEDDFVSTVSQELRRPLTSIYGFAETLLRRDVLFAEEERQTFLGYIASEAERLTPIVDRC